MICYYQYVENCLRGFSNPLFNYLDENKLLSAHKSGFRSNNSFANQLLAIVHETNS